MLSLHQLLPVDERINFSSKGKKGKADGSEPVAIMIFLALIWFWPPCVNVAVTLFGPVMTPVPLT